MHIDMFPIWGIFLGTIFIVLASIELGHRIGHHTHRRSADEKEGAVSGMSGAILGITAFILAFSFSIVSSRYDLRRSLVREDANAIRIAWARSAFLPEPARAESQRMLRRYLDIRTRFFHEGQYDKAHVRTVLRESEHLQRRLWGAAVASAPRDDIGALYFEALNELAAVHASRITVGLQARVPQVIWLTLLGLLVLGVSSIGYLTGIAGSNRSKATVPLAIAFATVITMIAAFDRPGVLTVSQQPLLDVQRYIEGVPLPVD
jgi:hypothetical protein